MATPYTSAGPGEGRKRKCPACDGTSKTRLRQKCEACDGTGKIAVDSYVGRVTASDARKPPPMTPERRESELQRLSSSFAIRAGDTDPEESYGWERAKASRDSQGSYRELDRALEKLRWEDPVGWEFLTGLYANNPDPRTPAGFRVERSAWADAREAQLVAQLSQWMPAKVRLPHRLHNELMDDKRRRVRELLLCGEPIEEIAGRVLLSTRTVQKLAS